MKLIHFTAEWCQPCKMMKPMIDQIISERDDIEYEMIDIDNNQEYAIKEGVMGVPTFILEKNGERVGRVSGAMTRNDFITKLGIS